MTAEGREAWQRVRDFVAREAAARSSNPGHQMHVDIVAVDRALAAAPDRGVECKWCNAHDNRLAELLSDYRSAARGWSPDNPSSSNELARAEHRIHAAFARLASAPDGGAEESGVTRPEYWSGLHGELRRIAKELRRPADRRIIGADDADTLERAARRLAARAEGEEWTEGHVQALRSVIDDSRGARTVNERRILDALCEVHDRIARTLDTAPPNTPDPEPGEDADGLTVDVGPHHVTLWTNKPATILRRGEVEALRADLDTWLLGARDEPGEGEREPDWPDVLLACQRLLSYLSAPETSEGVGPGSQPYTALLAVALHAQERATDRPPDGEGESGERLDMTADTRAGRTLERVLAILQRLAPSGSPPPGGPAALATWIVEATLEENARRVGLMADKDAAYNALHRRHEAIRRRLEEAGELLEEARMKNGRTAGWGSRTDRWLAAGGEEGEGEGS